LAVLSPPFNTFLLIKYLVVPDTISVLPSLFSIILAFSDFAYLETVELANLSIVAIFLWLLPD